MIESTRLVGAYPAASYPATYTQYTAFDLSY